MAASQLPDVSRRADRSLADDPGDALPGWRGCVTRSPATTIYAYYGQEQNNANFWTVNGTQGGLG